MVIQKVERASVSVDGEIRGEIGNGLMVLVGILPNDDEKVMDYMLEKLVNLRIYEDENDKLTFPLLDTEEDCCLCRISPFTGRQKGQETEYYRRGFSR